MLLQGLTLLEACIHRHFEEADQHQLGWQHFLKLDVDKVLSVVQLLLASQGGDPRSITEAASPVITKCSRQVSRECRHARNTSLRSLFPA